MGEFDKSYYELLQEHVDYLADWREKLCLYLEKAIMHSLQMDLLPPERGGISIKRARNEHLLQPFCCGKRIRNSSIPYMTSMLYQNLICPSK